MTDAPSRIIPNTFQTPNLLIDDGLMALLSGNEVKCYLVVIRKTFGWRKERDRIAKSQIAAATGLAETTVDDCMASLVRFGLVLRTAENNPANEGVEWAPQMDDRQIDYSGLETRQADAKSKNSKRMEKARMARGGVVQLPHLIQQPQGGVVQLPPQQPIKPDSLVMVKAGADEIYSKYDQEFGAPTPMIRDMVNDDIETYSGEWVLEAMEIAVGRNVRSWDYVRGILKRCKTAGKRPSLNRLETKERNNANTNSGNPKRTSRTKAAPAYTDADRAAAAAINQR